MAVAIGIDLGGTKIAGVVVDNDGAILARTIIPTETANEQTLVAGITKVALELQASAPAALRIGLAAAGLVDPRAGVVVTSPNLPIKNVALARMIEARVDIDVLLDNDANAAAFAEAKMGAARGAHSSVTVTVGTGIGGGVVLGGRLLRGARGFAGEIGHVVIDRGGPTCACGARGCLEALASGSALARMATERLGEPGSEALRGAMKSLGSISGELVGSLALTGDPFTVGLVQEAGASLGLGLASVANLIDPDRFIIGGGAGTSLFPIMGPAIEASLSQNVLGAGKRSVPDVVCAALGNEAGAIGAGLLAIDGNVE